MFMIPLEAENTERRGALGSMEKRQVLPVHMMTIYVDGEVFSPVWEYRAEAGISGGDSGVSLLPLLRRRV